VTGGVNKRLASLAGLTLTAALVFALTRGQGGESAYQPHINSLAPAAVPAKPAAATEALQPTRPVADLRAALSQGPLQGTEPDGAFVCDAASGLRPDNGLRRRMDWYSQMLGPMRGVELRALLVDDAKRLCGGAAAQLAGHLWDGYSGMTLPSSTANATLGERLASAHQTRVAALGPQWAAAFYEDDERAAAAMLSRNAAPLPSPSATPASPEAQQRMADLQTQWRDWDQRLAAAKSDLQNLRAASRELSPSQQHALLSQHFERADWPRAAALLGLPAPEL
jgi:hypothetical protein